MAYPPPWGTYDSSLLRFRTAFGVSSLDLHFNGNILYTMVLSFFNRQPSGSVAKVMVGCAVSICECVFVCLLPYIRAKVCTPWDPLYTRRHNTQL